ncbi:hypothetical protein G7009_17065 [Pseudomonas capeferrum]|uniref:hypothetical protein n=1 Tax=Pseudomonas capeferrum TaxID=1495066 RepID=UPI0015E44751|nr:hypothetical protein [Pseudomonas capeferrum]MBA1203441.1 hypothetical protein [Pseudomonas capeferrum]
MHLFRFRRAVLVALLGLLTTACVPYGGGGYYRTEYYSADRQVYPGNYGYDRGYRVAPQPRYYYNPPVRYHRAAPAPHFRPHQPPGLNPKWHNNPRNDHRYYGDRQRYDYGRDRDRNDYRNERRLQDNRRYLDQRSQRHPRHEAPRRQGSWQR